MKLKLLAVLTTVLTGSLVLTAPVPTMASDANISNAQNISAISAMGYQVVSSEINPVILTTTDFQNLSVDQQKAVSTNWGLTPIEYGQYLSDMQNSSDGLWYKNLDPAEVLLINAKNDEARNHYADIVVKLVHDRGERELAAQLAYQNAWQRLYPNLPRIRLNQGGSGSSDGMITLTSGDSLLFFTSLD